VLIISPPLVMISCAEDQGTPRGRYLAKSLRSTGGLLVAVPTSREQAWLVVRVAAVGADVGTDDEHRVIVRRVVSPRRRKVRICRPYPRGPYLSALFSYARRAAAARPSISPVRRQLARSFWSQRLNGPGSRLASAAMAATFLRMDALTLRPRGRRRPVPLPMGPKEL
jgi:hypothetical protein